MLNVSLKPVCYVLPLSIARRRHLSRCVDVRQVSAVFATRLSKQCLEMTLFLHEPIFITVGTSSCNSYSARIVYASSTGFVCVMHQVTGSEAHYFGSYKSKIQRNCEQSIRKYTGLATANRSRVSIRSNLVKICLTFLITMQDLVVSHTVFTHV